jgi:hypothetical protein
MCYIFVNTVNIITNMIVSFVCSDTEKLFYNKFTKRFNSISRQAQRKLKLLNSASKVICTNYSIL